MSTKYLLLSISALFLDMIGSCRERVPEYLEVSPNVVVFDSSGGSATIEVKSNKSWKVQVSDQWLNVYPLSGYENGRIQVNVHPNIRLNGTTQKRSGKIIVSGYDMESVVSIDQKGEAVADN